MATAFRRARALVGILWRADPALFVWFGLVVLVLGLLPNASVLATGMLVSVLPDAVASGPGSTAWNNGLLAVGLVALGFLASGVFLTLARLLSELMNTALMREVSRTASRAFLTPHRIAALEDPHVVRDLDAIRDFERTGLYVQTPWALRILASMRIAGLGAALILSTFTWWAPIAILAGWVVANQASSRWMERGFAAVRAEGAGDLRRAEYLRGVALGPEAAKEIRVFGLADWVGVEYARTWLRSMSAVWRARRAQVRTLALGTGAVVSSHAVVVGALAWHAVHGHIGIGAVTVYGLAVLGMGELGFLGDPHWRVSRAASLAEQLLDVERRLLAENQRSPSSAPAHASATGPVRPAGTSPVRADPTGAPSGPVEVRLQGVTFGYSPHAAPVLDHLDLHIPAGQSVAIVGENGAGKTTLIKLICGFYEPAAGKVLLDGQDLAMADLPAVRRRIGAIFQHFIRYELPLRDNVGFGAPAHLDDHELLEAALRDAGAGDLLTDLPASWQTVLAHGYPQGADLSGGQWQKVALARALVAVRAGAGLLILDEPTASLDVRAESELFDRFLALTRDTTTVLVTHRLWSVRRADRIVVLSGGRIVEDGDHDTLMALGGRYATMFRLQAHRFGVVPHEDPQACGARASTVGSADA